MRVSHVALSFFICTLVWGALPFVPHAVAVQAPQQLIIPQTGFTLLPGVPLGAGNYQTSFKAGDRGTFRVHVQSPKSVPTISVNLSQLGGPSATTTSKYWGNQTYTLNINGVYYYPVYTFTLASITISPDVSDGLKTIYSSATDALGNIATSTFQIVVDNTPPTLSLSDVSFSATPPKGGDLMYLSGRADGTGSAIKLFNIRTLLLDAKGMVFGYGEISYDSSSRKTYMDGFSAAFAASTDGTFTRIPMSLIESPAYKIADATSIRVSLVAYDGSGHIVTTSLTVPVPKTPPDPCVAAGNCASNVLFLPGIEASRLYEDLPCSDGVCSTKLWEPGGDTLASRLAHDATGASVNSGIYATGVIDNAYVPIKGNIYKSFIEQMDVLATGTPATIKEWEAIPYDWRLTPDQILSSGALVAPGKISYLVATSSPYIIQELRRLAATSKTGKVTIIAHSNGGLLAKALTQKLGAVEAAKLIDKIVFVAVPQVGTPQAIGALLHGYDQGLPVKFFAYALSSGVARTLAANMPMTYNLLPSASYFTQVDDPVATFTDQPFLADFRARYGDLVHSQERLHTFVTDAWRTASSTTEGLNYPSVGNELLLTRAETLHADLDNWVPPTGVQLYEVAGWGEKTLAGIDYYQGVETHCDQFSGQLSRCTKTPKIDYRPRLVLDGDGTVVTPSALWTPGAKRYWVDLNTYAKDNRLSAPLGRQHADILEVPQLRTFLQNIITNNENSVLPEYLSTSAPVNTKTGTELHFTLHSPLSLNLYDDQGRHTGISTTTGELEEDIPESRYLKFGEVQFISAPASLHTRLVMNGYAEGSFTLNAEEVSGETIIASTTFAGVPSTVSTLATIDVPSGGLANAGALSVDENGDGTTDVIIAPRMNDVAVFKMSLTVTANDTAVTLGASMPAFSATLSGFADGDTASSSDITGAPECAVNVATTTVVGMYPITCTIGTLSSETYEFTTFIPGTFSVRYRWDGFSQPVRGTAHQAGQGESVFKGGSTIPVKFQLKSVDGVPVQAPVAPIWSVDGGASASYKWDSTAQRYVYNWSTKGLAAGQYTVYAKLDDGQTYSVTIGLK